MTHPTITIRKVKLHDGRTLHMKQPLVLEVHYTEGAPFEYVVRHDELDIYSFGHTREFVEHDLTNEIRDAWCAYVENYEDDFPDARKATAARWREIAEVREAPMTREEQYAWEAVQRDLDRDLMNRADREPDNDP